MTETKPDNVVLLRKPVRKAQCPICSKPTADDYRPFCSKRCADIDLYRWLGEDYRISTEELPGSDDFDR